MRILRYEIGLNDQGTEIELPSNAEVLSVACKPGDVAPSLWVRLPDWPAMKSTRRFRVVGTGHKVEEALDMRLRFVGTAICEMSSLGIGVLVWHVFEVERDATRQGVPESLR